MIFRFSADTLI